MSRVLANWCSQIPSDYDAASTYRSASEIKESLKKESTNEMMMFDMSGGRLSEALRKEIVPKNPVALKECDDRMEFAFIVFSCTCLFQPLSLAT